MPKGTVLVSQNQVACRLKEFIEDPDDFRPERWIDENSKSKIHNFLVLPFGYGQRGCIGKSIAETSMLMFIVRFFSQFTLSWKGGKLDCETKLINRPDVPLMFDIK